MVAFCGCRQLDYMSNEGGEERECMFRSKNVSDVRASAGKGNERIRSRNNDSSLSKEVLRQNPVEQHNCIPVKTGP